MGKAASSAPLGSEANGAHSGDAGEQLPKMAVDGALVDIKLEDSIAVVRFVTHAAAPRCSSSSLRPVPKLHVHGNMLQHRC